MPARRMALVIAPTRELALQVQRELAGSTPRRADASPPASAAWTFALERRALERGAHIVVGTPGRLRDHLERGALDLSELRVRARRSRRDARPRLPGGLGIHPRRRAGRAAHPDVLRHRRQAHRRAGAQLIQRDALRISTLAATGQHADITYLAHTVRPKSAKTRSSTCCAFTRRRALGVLRDARSGEPAARAPA
jgi:ATP-dependent RNA helicase DeaD